MSLSWPFLFKRRIGVQVFAEDFTALRLTVVGVDGLVAGVRPVARRPLTPFSTLNVFRKLIHLHLILFSSPQ